MVVTSWPCTDETVVEQAVTALPLTRQVQALQTFMPQPYLGPVMPSLSRSTQSSAMPAGGGALTALPVTLKLEGGIGQRPRAGGPGASPPAAAPRGAGPW